MQEVRRVGRPILRTGFPRCHIVGRPRLEAELKLLEHLVCLLAALEAVLVEVDVLVLREANLGIRVRQDEDTCDPKEDEEALIMRLSQEADAFARIDVQLSGEHEAEGASSGLTPLREEIVRYHCRYRPSRRAQIVFRAKAVAGS